MKIAVGVVTFNRLDFLKELIESIRNQSRKADYISVVNNSSEDGTEEWLSQQEDLIVYKQDNVGSSGGQNASIKQLQKTDAEYFWIMDDDVIPRVDCLENLEKNAKENRVIAPVRYTPKNEIFWNDTIEFNLTNPFKGLWKSILNKDYYDSNNNFIPAVGITFEGPFFHRSLIDKIGYSEQNFFIYGDDTDFMIKAFKAGYEVGLIKSAQMDRKLDYAEPRDKFSWKHYYIIRNGIAIDRLHANFITRNLRPYLYFIKWLGRAKNTEEKETVRKAFRDAWTYPTKDSNKAIGYE